MQNLINKIILISYVLIFVINLKTIIISKVGNEEAFQMMYHKTLLADKKCEGKTPLKFLDGKRGLVHYLKSRFMLYTTMLLFLIYSKN